MLEAVTLEHSTVNGLMKPQCQINHRQTS